MPTVAARSVGLAAVAGGVALAAWPRVTLLVVSQLAGWVMGVTGLLRAVEAAGEGRVRSWAFLGGLAGGALGVALIIWPGRTLLVATVLAGTWLIVDGAARVLGTLADRNPRDEVLGNLLGALQVLCGVAVVARPVAGVRAAAVVMGAGLVLHGLAWLRPAARPAAQSSG